MSVLANSQSPTPSPSRKRHRVAASVLDTLLEAGGCVRSSAAHYLVDDSAALARFLDARLMLDADLKTELLQATEARLAENVDLHAALLPMAPKTLGGVNHGDSLARVLLNVTCVQQEVAALLLQKLPELVDVDGGGGDANLAALILAQLRWLDHIVSSGELVTTVLEVLAVCPTQLQAELMNLLPEVALDNHHRQIVEALEEMINEDVEFLVPALDTFTAMGLERELMNLVVELVSQKLHCARVEDLPATVRFLVQSATADNAKTVVQRLRQHLNLVSTSDARDTVPDRKQKGKMGGGGGEANILDAVRTGMRFKTSMGATFLRELKDLGKPETPHKVLDIWVLLVLHGNGGPQRKTVETMFHRKVATHQIKAPLLDRSILTHGKALHECFPSLLAISESLLRAKQELTREMGGHLYTLCFRAFDDAYHRSEVLRALVGHTGSGMMVEAGAALNALVKLTATQAVEMLPHSVYVSSLLDYLDAFQAAQLQAVFEVFSDLAVAAFTQHSQADESSIDDMSTDSLRMVIRKQLSSPNLKYKRMGIIGGVTLAGRLSRVVGPDTPSTPAQVRSAQDVILMVRQLCEGQPACEAFLADELATMLEAPTTIHPEVVSSLFDSAQDQFEQTFVVDLDDNQRLLPDEAAWTDVNGRAWRSELWYNLDGDEAPVAIRLMRFATATTVRGGVPGRDSLLTLCPLMRLVATLHHRTHDSNDEIEAMLGCPLALCPPERVWDTQQPDLPAECEIAAMHPAEAEAVCLSVLHAVGWIREILNAFTFESLTSCSRPRDAELNEKLLLRIRNLISLQKLLNVCMEAHPYIKLPSLTSPISSVDAASSKALSLPDSKSTSKKKGKSKTVQAVAGGSEPSQAATPGPTGMPAGAKGKGGRAKGGRLEPAAGISMEACRLLSPAALSLLSTPLPTGPAEADALPMYAYLLEELVSQLTAKPSGLKGLQAVGVAERAGPSTALLDRLASLLPALRRLCNASVTVLQRRTQQIASTSTQIEPIPATTLACTEDAARRSLRLILTALRRLLLSPDTCHHLGAVLAALHPQNAPEPVQRGAVDDAGDASTAEGVVDWRGLAPALQYLAELLTVEGTLCVECEVLVVQLMGLLVTKAEDSGDVEMREPKTKLGNASGVVLERAGGNLKSEHLLPLIQANLSHSHDPLDTILNLATNVFMELPPEGDKKSEKVCVEGYPTLSRSTFPLWYKVTLEQLALQFAALARGLGRAADDAEWQELFTQLTTAARALAALQMLTKRYGHRANVLIAAAGIGARCLNHVLKAMDAMEAKFADNKEAILGLITVFQKSTRQMHNVVNESKARKDAALAAKVPMVKKTLERFVFRVKLLSETSGGGELKFWVGNLKHRDLKGQEISSQMELEEDDDPLSDEEGTEADELLAADHDQHADLAALDDEQRSELGSEYT